MNSLYSIPNLLFDAWQKVDYCSKRFKHVLINFQNICQAILPAVSLSSICTSDFDAFLCPSAVLGMITSWQSLPVYDRIVDQELTENIGAFFPDLIMCQWKPLNLGAYFRSRHISPSPVIKYTYCSSTFNKLFDSCPVILLHQTRLKLTTERELHGI